MSLWSKPITDITFKDVEQFCEAGLAEGTELDYKRELTKGIWQTVGAMSNTRGGLIILGVDEDPDTATPVVPVCGFPIERGIEARVIQLCRDRLSPPVLPEVSKPLPLPSDPDRCVVVVRVSYSQAAPHAHRNKPQIFVRTGSLSNPEDLAGVDRIAHLLRGREAWERKREELLVVCLQRFESIVHLPQMLENAASHTPLLVSGYIVPTFPSGPVCTPATAYEMTDHGNRRRVPGGVLWRIRQRVQHFGTWGEVVRAEAMPPHGDYETPTVRLSGFLEFLRALVENGKKFYSQEGVDVAGPLRFGLSFKGSKGYRLLFGEWDPGEPLLDDQFDLTIDIETRELLESEPRKLPMPHFLHQLLCDAAYSWDAPTPPDNWAPRYY